MGRRPQSRLFVRRDPVEKRDLDPESEHHIEQLFERAREDSSKA